MKQILLVFLGGGLGSALRYGVGRFVITKNMSPLWATFSVNILGSLIIGLVLGFVLKNHSDNNQLTLLIATGFCGGFTTFSAFAFENQQLLKNGDITTMLIYTIGSFAIGILAVFLGLWSVKLLG